MERRSGQKFGRTAQFYPRSTFLDPRSPFLDPRSMFLEPSTFLDLCSSIPDRRSSIHVPRTLHVPRSMIAVPRPSIEPSTFLDQSSRPAFVRSLHNAQFHSSNNSSIVESTILERFCATPGLYTRVFHPRPC